MKSPPPPADTLSMKSGRLCSERVSVGWCFLHLECQGRDGASRESGRRTGSRGPERSAGRGHGAAGALPCINTPHNDLNICHGKLNLPFHFVPSVSRSLPILPAPPPSTPPNISRSISRTCRSAFLRWAVAPGPSSPGLPAPRTLQPQTAPPRGAESKELRDEVKYWVLRWALSVKHCFFHSGGWKPLQPTL